MTIDEKEIQQQLKELILDEDFTRLKNLVNKEVNLMDVLKVSNKELPHSNFLAWFLNPKGNHGLGDFGIKEFIKTFFRENEFQDFGTDQRANLSVFDFVKLDLEDLKIQREYKFIDLILLSEKSKFCLVIENKIYSGEREGQLNNYRDKINLEFGDYVYKIFIYLSLEEQEISEKEKSYYIQLTYLHVFKLIDLVLNSSEVKLSENTKFVFEQYLLTLKTLLNMDENIKNLAEELYNRYKDAFDLVFKYSGPSDNNEVGQKISSLIKDNSTLKPFRSDKNIIRFQPNWLFEERSFFIEKGFFEEYEKIEENVLFLFEFNLRGDKVNFDFKIGKSENADARIKLFEIFKKNSDFFKKVKNKEKLSPQYQIAFQKEILSKIDYQGYYESGISSVEDKIEKNFNYLVNNDIPKILNILKNN